MAAEREVLDVDVLFVGGGPAGLAGAMHLQRKIEEHNTAAQQSGGKVLDEPFSPENGFMTATLKMRRNVIAERLADNIEELYK